MKNAYKIVLGIAAMIFVGLFASTETAQADTRLGISSAGVSFGIDGRGGVVIRTPRFSIDTRDPYCRPGYPSYYRGPSRYDYYRRPSPYDYYRRPSPHDYRHYRHNSDYYRRQLEHQRRIQQEQLRYQRELERLRRQRDCR